MRRRFATLDVFTQRRFAGNPLAVVLEAEGLEADVMQAIAREFNHPETVFVFALADAGHRARVRIFTPVQELPFAGHPTVGTAVLLALCDGAVAGSDLVLEEGLGAVRCTLESVNGAGGAARFVIPKLPREVGPAADTAAIAAALSLEPSDIDGRPARGSAGIPFTFVAIRSLDAMARCRPDPAKFDAAFPDRSAYVFCSETADPGHHFHARMFAPSLGIPEDPATGSA
jgi:trans-2,3-dihydro-3-hydroxyanthranilate isomerase